ncbi:hypothetical protein P0D73_31455 [Paraburkholderia sp. RL18-101-BIB-B]
MHRVFMTQRAGVGAVSAPRRAFERLEVRRLEMHRKRWVDDGDVEVRRLDVFHAGVPELTVKTRFFEHLLTLRDYVRMHVDAIRRIPLGVSVLKKPSGADRVIQQTDPSIQLPATDETPHERGDRIGREELPEVLTSRGGKFAVMSDGCSLRAEADERAQWLIPVGLERKQISLHNCFHKKKRPA